MREAVRNEQQFSQASPLLPPPTQKLQRQCPKPKTGKAAEVGGERDGTQKLSYLFLKLKLEALPSNNCFYSSSINIYLISHKGKTAEGHTDVSLNMKKIKDKY